MRANELRIGNWVDNNGTQFQIKDGEDIDDHLDHDCFKPIPITEEWLVRCGATKRIVSEWQFHLNIGAVKLYLRKNINWYCELEGIYLGDRIQYLHQLQNLYFDLKGQELVINS